MRPADGRRGGLQWFQHLHRRSSFMKAMRMLGIEDRPIEMRENPDGSYAARIQPAFNGKENK